MDFTKSFERLNEAFKDIMPLKHGYGKEQFSNYRYADCDLNDACPFKNIGAEAYLLLPETKIKKVHGWHTVNSLYNECYTCSWRDACIHLWASDEYKSYQLYSSNDYSDIGMSMVKYTNGGFQIVSVTPGTPAGNAGLTSGMVITAIDGTSVMDADIDDVRILIRSRLNTKFAVSVGKDTYMVDCSRTYVSPVSYRLEKTMAGYVQIKTFEAGSGTDAVNAIEDLLSQKAVALCIDVRGNEGGLAQEVAILLDYLLPSGEMFAQVDKEGHRNVSRSDAMSLQLPMVVLIDSRSYGNTVNL